MNAPDAEENTSSRSRSVGDNPTVTRDGGALDDQERISIEELRRSLALDDGNRLAAFGELSTIGFGGHGAVFAAREPGLNREVALKILRPEFRNRPRYLESFIREARITAQIDHPNIIPVHHLGVFDDVGAYFTMKRVEGETLRAMLKELASGNRDYVRRYSLNRRLEIFLAIGQGVAFAHSRGVIHRDLKPGNIMLGEYGEVLVMDWGLAQYRVERDTAASGGHLSVEADIRLPGRGLSHDAHGRISGTPANMAPEQALGEDELIDEMSDQYGLGTILYSLLTLLPSPFDSLQATDRLLEQVVRGQIVSPRRAAPRLRIPRELEAIAMKALSLRREERYPNVDTMLQDVRNYLDKYPVSAYSPSRWYHFGKLVLRRPLIPLTVLLAGTVLGSVNIVQRIDAFYQARNQVQMARYVTEKGLLNLRAAERIYSQLHLSPEQAEELRRLSREFITYNDQALEILTQAGRSPFARNEILHLLVQIVSSEIDFFIKTENYPQLERRLAQLRDPNRGELSRVLLADAGLRRRFELLQDAVGILEVSTYPVGRLVLQEESGRMIPLGEAPLRSEIAAGNYILGVSAEGCPPLRIPLSIRTGATSSLHLDVPRVLPRKTVYIPAGEVYLSHRMAEISSKAWVPGFFIARDEVTLGEYQAFWRSLATPRDRQRYVPKRLSDMGILESIFAEDGTLFPPYSPDLPVTGISGEAATAFCVWKSKSDGVSCRLPSTEEWERAARGSDSREFVWGNDYKPGFALLRDHPRRVDFPAGPAIPGSFPNDVSRFGVNDMTGNVREFTTAPGLAEEWYAIKGGSYATPPFLAACSQTDYSSGAGYDIGFRYIIEYVPEKP